MCLVLVAYKHSQGGEAMSECSVCCDVCGPCDYPDHCAACCDCSQCHGETTDATTQQVITINADGTLSYVGVDTELEASASSLTRRRASRVLPTSSVKRLAFRALRWAFCDSSAAAAWTRVWRGPWVVDLSLSNGPQLGPFASRADAINAEVCWLRERQ